MILMNDFKAEPEEIRVAMLGAVKRVIDSGWYVLGNEVEAFEKKWASVCGMEGGVGIGNGMDALEIGLRSLGIGPGDEVITTPMTAFATVLAILRAGATPILADIDIDTALLSISSARRCITSKTKGVLLVHLYGQMRQMDEWTSFCKENGLYLMEDCAQSHLASWRGGSAGSFGNFGAYSFYPTKNLGALGDAGMIVSDSKDILEKAKKLRNYGQSERYHHPIIGMNSRLDEVQAAILSERLKWLPEFTMRRKKIAFNYYAGIANPLVSFLARPEEDNSHVYHLFVIGCEKRNALQAHLMERGIQALIHYPLCIHEQQSSADMARDPKGLGASELHARTCLSLPCHPQMNDSDVLNVINAVNSFRG